MKPRVELKQRAEGRIKDYSEIRKMWITRERVRPAIVVIDGAEFSSEIPQGPGASTEINTAAERLVEEFKKL